MSDEVELGAEPGVLVRYGSSGGRPPRDDERLEVTPDGAWTARRTLGGRRVGRFAGELDPDALAALAAEVAAVAGSGEVVVPTPRHGATEAVDVAGAAATLGSNEDAPGAWRALVERLRGLVKDEVVASPVAALDLEASVDAARIVQRGPEEVRLEPATLRLRIRRVAPDGTPMGRVGGARRPRRAFGPGARTRGHRQGRPRLVDGPAVRARAGPGPG